MGLIEIHRRDDAYNVVSLFPTVACGLVPVNT